MRKPCWETLSVLGAGKGDSAAKAKNTGSIQDFQGAKKTFADDDDSD